MHPVPIVLRATVQAIVRQPLLNAERPATIIAIAGSQKTSKALHGLARISRDLHVVPPGSIGPSVDSNIILRLKRRSWQQSVKLRGQFGDFGEAEMALGERSGERLLNHALVAVARDGNLAHQQIARPLEQLLLAER